MTDRPSTTEVAEQDTEARWRAQIAKELRGRTFESLLAKSEDGLQIEPLYTGRHLEELDCLDPFPGRGLNARGFASRRDGHWKICPELALDDPQMLVHMAAEQAALGADVAWCRFVPTPGPRVGRDNSGIRGCSLRAVASSIAGVAAAKLPLIVETGAVASPIAAAMERHGDTFSGVSLTIDLFGDRAARGVVAASREVIEEELRACLSWVKDREGTDVRLLCATQPFHEAGATAAQELGIAMSLLVGTLRQVEDSGADFEQALRALLIRVSVGRDLFTEIAKLRAVRVLWSQVMGACGFGTMHHEVEIAARGSWRERTAVDPWVNLLRGTTETFAAAVGGASMITTVPMHAALPGESEMARRLATNTQVLLRRESHVGEVMDTAGGSYYVEWLTNSLALEGWKWFQRIEACGGIATALQTNAIHEWIAEKRGAQDQRVADRTLAIIGVSDFPASGSSAPRDYRVPSPSRRGGGASHLIPR
ncbi:MAG: methylmalonyl-CoA mutase family protein, partial [Nannocystaceae bacterium]